MYPLAANIRDDQCIATYSHTNLANAGAVWKFQSVKFALYI